MKQLNLIGLPFEHLHNFLLEHKIESYRAHQIFIWVYHYKRYDFDLMTNLSKPLRILLKQHFYFTLPQIRSATKSQDGSIKYLFQLEDGLTIESVWMPTDQRKTLCVSTQARKKVCSSHSCGPGAGTFATHRRGAKEYIKMRINCQKVTNASLPL